VLVAGAAVDRADRDDNGGCGSDCHQHRSGCPANGHGTAPRVSGGRDQKVPNAKRRPVRQHDRKMVPRDAAGKQFVRPLGGRTKSTGDAENQ
jgi:hypothetical protein